MSTIDFGLTFDLMELANEAYQVTLSSDQFAAGYTRLDGSVELHYSLEQWAAHNGYTVIQNPGGTDPFLRNWGIVALRGSRLVVALRGTSWDVSSWNPITWQFNDIAIDALGGLSIKDPFTGNISYPFAPWTLTVGGQQQTVWVHRNMLNTYLLIQAGVRAAVQNILSQQGSAVTGLYVTGHSLGGGLAALCALDLQLFLGATYTTRPQLVTFAAPYVGNQDFATLLAQQVPGSQRFTVPGDPVPLVPTRGWTPAWLAWFDGGQHGPEPTRYASYVQAGTAPALPSVSLLDLTNPHALTTYHAKLLSIVPTRVNPAFTPSDPVTSLVLRIKTADTLGAGTDVAISVNTLGVYWGVLGPFWADEFERGSLYEYDLFKSFPSRVPASPIVAYLTGVTLIMGSVSIFDVWDGDWKPSYVDVLVNGQQFARLNFEVWVSPSTSVTRTIAL